MITKTQVDYLLDLPKHIFEDEKYLERKNYMPSLPINDRIYMASKADDDFIFFLDIWQSSKNQLKMKLHYQEEEASIGLLRIDFNGRHHNPEIENDNVPDEFKPYAGKWIEESHIHYFIEGYKTLNWAIPLSIDESFPIKTFTDSSQIGSIIQAFGKKINLKTQLTITFQTNLQ